MIRSSDPTTDWLQWFLLALAVLLAWLLRYVIKQRQRLEKILTAEIRELIASRAPIRVLKAAAVRNGTRFLRDAALAAVERGESTLEEADRVTLVG